MTQIALNFVDEASAIAALAAVGISGKDKDGVSFIPTTGTINSVRFDIAIAGGGSGAVMLPTGATQADSAGHMVPVYAAQPGFHLDLLTDAALTFDPAHIASGGPQTAFVPLPTQVVVPTTVPMWAAQAALKLAGKYDAVNTAITTMETTNPPVFFAWTMGNYADRNSAFIGALAAGFGMTSADIDNLFIAADKIANAAG